MNNKELVSIIIPFYKGESYINVAITSVIEQSYDNFELLLIENGEKDNSEKIIKSYNDKRIKYFYLDEGNVSKARNFGIENSKGKYIYFMDGDDRIDKDCLLICLSKLKKENVDMVMFNIDRIKIDKIDKTELPWKNEVLDSSRIKKELIPTMIYPRKNEMSVMGSACRLFTKSEYVKKIRFKENIKFAEDLLFCIELFSIIKSVYVLNESLYFYIMNGESTLNRYKKDIIYNSINLHNEMKNILEKRKLVDSEITYRFFMNKGRMYPNAISFSSRCSDKKIAKKEIENIIEIFKNDNYNYLNLEYPFLIKFTFILLKLKMKNTLLLLYKLKEGVRKRKYN